VEHVDYAIPCPSCGLPVARGFDGCLQVYWERMGRPFSGGEHDRHTCLAWDTYCVQHPDHYCVSTKSLIAHLGGLCWAMEYSGHRSGYQALTRVLNRTRAIPKPEIPSFRGTLTIADVPQVADTDAAARAIERWALDVWAAYRTLHPVARQWIATALAEH